MAPEIKNRPTQQNWSDLPAELLELILKKLSFSGIVRFKSLCSSWNTAAKSYTSSRFYRQTPWLIIPSEDEKKSSFFSLAENVDTNFFSLEENKVYKLKNVIEGFTNRAWCVGSSYGWLVILDQNINLHLLKPFSRAKFQLPSIIYLFDLDVRYQVLLMKFSFDKETIPSIIDKAIVLLDPSWRSSNNNFIVVVIHSVLPSRLGLAFYKYGEEKWSNLGSKKRNYSDIICHNNKLYAVSISINSRSSSIEVWDFVGGLCPTKVAKVRLNMDKITHSLCYLVESMGEILFVSQCIYDPLRISKYGTVFFCVYKLDCNEKRLVSVKSLENHQVLFVVGDKMRSISARDFPECKENSIYFVDDYWAVKYDKNDIGVYDLQENKVRKLGVDDNWNIYLPSFWNNSSCFWIVPS